MRIAFIGRGTLGSNASTLRCLGLAPSLTSAGHEIGLFLPDKEGNDEIALGADEIHVHLCGTRFEFLPKLKRLLTEKWDIIHCLNVGLNSYLVGDAYKTFRRYGRIILDADELMPLLFRSRMRRLVVNAIEYYAQHTADGIICASHELAEHYQSRVAVPVKYLPYGINAELFAARMVRSPEIRKEYGSDRLLVYMGTLLPHFHLDRLVKDFGAVVRKEPNARLVILGDGPERGKLTQIAERHAPDKVEFTGYVSEEFLPAYLAAADVLVFPIEDTLLNRMRCPNKTYQMLAAGRPIVTNRVGEVEKTLGSYAHYYQFGSTEDFVEKVQEAIHSPKVPPKERRLDYAWSIRANEYLKFLDLLI